MATGNGPRQRMINMMYLVLTALLAMNVSAEILSAFETLRDSLQSSALTTIESNKAFAKAMKEAIRKEVEDQRELKNAKLPDTLDLIARRTEEMIALLDGHIAEMSQIGQLDPTTGRIVNKAETELNLQYWLGQGKAQEQNGGSGAGKARELRAALNAYGAFVTEIYNRQPIKDGTGKPMRLPADSLTIKDPNEVGAESGQRLKWERHTFEGPVVANLAQLEAMKIAVYSQQKMLLDHLNQRLGAIPSFVADKVVAMDAPMSTVVTAGMEYETRLFAVLTSSQLKPRFSASTGALTTDPSGGSARLVIPANASAIPKGQNQGTVTYSASIQVPKATGGVENVSIQGKFTVRKPEIVITSAAVQNLYRACGNPVNIDVPALGDLYNPAVAASGAEVKGSAESKKKWLIVPGGDRCAINVKSNTNGQTIDIGSVEYRVIEPPKPTIVMKTAGGDAYNGTTPVGKSQRMCFSLAADAEFRSALPNDARYEIGQIAVYAQIGLGAPRLVATEDFSGRDATTDLCVNMPVEVRQAAGSVRVYYQIKGIYRKNFKGQKIEDKRFLENERTKAVVTRES